MTQAQRMPAFGWSGGERDSPGAVVDGASERECVLLVDDDPAQLRLLEGLLADEGYRLLSADGGAAALRLVQEDPPDLILLDLRMPEPDGFTVLDRLREDGVTSRIPVVALTAADEREWRLQALERGAREFLPKPVDRAELRARVRWMLYAKRRADDLDQAEAVLLAVGRTVEARDPGLKDHCERLAHMAFSLGQGLGLGPDDLRALRSGAYLHDIGKLALPDSVLFKPGRLNRAEWALVQTHPVIGEQILRPLRTLDAVRPLVRHHHERLDGSGYPDGLRGEEIPMPIRVLSLADAFDTLTRVRSYRPALGADEALDTLRGEAERGWWDRVVLERLERYVIRWRRGPS